MTKLLILLLLITNCSMLSDAISSDDSSGDSNGSSTSSSSGGGGGGISKQLSSQISINEDGDTTNVLNYCYNEFGLLLSYTDIGADGEEAEVIIVNEIEEIDDDIYKFMEGSGLSIDDDTVDKSWFQFGEYMLVYFWSDFANNISDSLLAFPAETFDYTNLENPTQRTIYDHDGIKTIKQTIYDNEDLASYTDYEYDGDNLIAFKEYNGDEELIKVTEFNYDDGYVTSLYITLYENGVITSEDDYPYSIPYKRHYNDDGTISLIEYQSGASTYYLYE